MSTTKDNETIIVVGAGIVGSATALALTQRGVNVLVIDRLDPGQGCSYGNAGIVAVDHIAPLANLDTLRAIPSMLFNPAGPLRLRASALATLAPWFFRFARESMPTRFRANMRALANLICASPAAWNRLCATGVTANVYRDTGTLYVYERVAGDADRPTINTDEARHLANLDQYGVRYTTLSAEAVRKQYLPALKVGIDHGRFLPDMASIVNPARAVRQIMQTACSAGARFVRDDVRTVRRRAPGIIEVSTPERTYCAAKVILCGGVATRTLLKQLGRSIPLIRERGYHLMLQSPGTELLPLPVAFMRGGFTCNPMEEGVRLAGTVEFGARDAPDWRRADMLAAHFASVFGFKGEISIASRWVGDRPTLPDYLPVIGALPDDPDVLVGTGHQHLGLTSGPLTGELLAQLVTAAPTSIDLTPFRLDRF
ncbi:NAD(P)/FAD-dependent oxidoreductase [Paraburkholderia sp. MM5482-R1]|uniref:NAD(P)/FAD-dependent oxidoreductase n=1 Tax=unclassified Paraburkholderia TaxID=2615204 RepID=UPI003D1B5CC7